VTTLGNAMIQPTMYFNLRHVPMFTGPYYIMDVKHKITPGKFDTTFTGIRQQIFALPKLDSYIQTLTQKLVSELIEEIKQNKKTGSESNTATTSNNVTTVVNEVSRNTNELGNPQNCEGDLKDNGYLSGNNKAKVDFIAATQSQTILTPQSVVNSIKTNVISGNNITNKYLAFITMYIESFKNNQFIAWNNNYAGVKLNYVWPGDLRKYFNQNYLCSKQIDNTYVPYATFDNIDNVSKLLNDYWSKYSGVSVSAENLAKLWITKWNKKKMSNSDFESFKKNNDDIYKDIVNTINDGIDLAFALKL
jgi:hypothetical protein